MFTTADRTLVESHYLQLFRLRYGSTREELWTVAAVENLAPRLLPAMVHFISATDTPLSSAVMQRWADAFCDLIATNTKDQNGMRCGTRLLVQHNFQAALSHEIVALCVRYGVVLKGKET